MFQRLQLKIQKENGQNCVKQLVLLKNNLVNVVISFFMCGLLYNVYIEFLLYLFLAIT